MAFCSCGHSHLVVRNPDEMPWSRIGGSFIRVYDAGVFRSLTDRESIGFLEALQEMPWSWRNKTQERRTHRPANGERRVRSRHGSAGSEDALRAFFDI